MFFIYFCVYFNYIFFVFISVIIKPHLKDSTDRSSTVRLFSHVSFRNFIAELCTVSASSNGISVCFVL